MDLEIKKSDMFSQEINETTELEFTYNSCLFTLKQVVDEILVS